MSLLVPAVTGPPRAAAMPFRASAGRPVPRATHNAAKAIGRNSSSHHQHGHRELHADSRSSADLQYWSGRQRSWSQANVETFRRMYLSFGGNVRRTPVAVKALPGTHGTGLVSRPAHLTRRPPALFGPAWAASPCGDAQVLGITQIFGQPADRKAVSMKGEDRSQGLIAEAEGRG